jgi:prepilin-type N-terminal cleavage/methylation domain-containing protein
MNRRQAGFSFIEILVVMSIIVVLASAVAVVIPYVLRKNKETGCVNNVSGLVTLMVAEYGASNKGWPKYNGKNFVLSLFLGGVVDTDNEQSLAAFFCPGDPLLRRDDVESARYKEINKDTLKSNDFHDLTSYAGRRAAEEDYLITLKVVTKGKPLMCDDDDGPLHHPNGIVIGFADKSVRLVEWEDLGLTEPEDSDRPEPFLGDSSVNEDLKALSSQ